MQLDGQQQQAVRYCVREVMRRRLLTGVPIPNWLRRLDRDLSMSACGPKTQVPQEELETTIDTAEAAALLGYSTRHVRRIAADLDGRLVAGRWIFHRRTVAEYADAKEHTDG